MNRKNGDDAWTSIPCKESVKSKYDEARSLTDLPLNVIADRAIGSYLRDLKASLLPNEAEPVTQDPASTP